MINILPSFEALVELFDYNVLTGRLIYRKAPGGSRKIGSLAGGVDQKGYYRVRIQGTDYKASRIIYKIMTGCDPGELTIDHIDNNQANDCIWNLRTATQAEQIQNRRLTGSGVRKTKSGRYQMRIMIEGTRIARMFSTYEEAVADYLSRSMKHPLYEQTTTKAFPLI